MMKVAVIDDNPLVVRAIASTIDWAALGCVVVGIADNGEDAQTLICEQRVDIVISDIKMPGMDGLALCERINALDLRIKVILITGYQEFELAQQAVRVGAFDLLSKPVSNDAVCRVVKNAMEALEKERTQHPRLASTRAPDDASPVVRRAISYLERHFAEDVTLEELGAKLIVNPSYLSRVIKKESGQGFVEILTDIRLDMAKRMLEQPGAKVYEVAEQVGYKDYAYFYQVFKKRFGISPKAYRKQLS